MNHNEAIDLLKLAIRDPQLADALETVIVRVDHLTAALMRIEHLPGYAKGLEPHREMVMIAHEALNKR